MVIGLPARCRSPAIARCDRRIHIDLLMWEFPLTRDIFHGSRPSLQTYKRQTPCQTRDGPMPRAVLRIKAIMRRKWRCRRNRQHTSQGGRIGACLRPFCQKAHYFGRQESFRDITRYGWQNCFQREPASVGDQSASSTACFGLIRRAFGHAGVDPGHNLVDLCTRQKRPLQRHLPKAADTPR
jgi:hypothetical protein